MMNRADVSLAVARVDHRPGVRPLRVVADPALRAISTLVLCNQGQIHGVNSKLTIVRDIEL